MRSLVLTGHVLGLTHVERGRSRWGARKKEVVKQLPGSTALQRGIEMLCGQAPESCQQGARHPNYGKKNYRAKVSQATGNRKLNNQPYEHQTWHTDDGCNMGAPTLELFTVCHAHLATRESATEEQGIHFTMRRT